MSMCDGSDAVCVSVLVSVGGVDCGVYAITGIWDILIIIARSDAWANNKEGAYFIHLELGAKKVLDYSFVARICETFVVNIMLYNVQRVPKLEKAAIRRKSIREANVSLNHGGDHSDPSDHCITIVLKGLSCS